MDSIPRLLVFLGTSLQRFLPGATKSCKITEEVVRMKENFAFSGQIVRVLTMKTRYQTCDASKPECCGNYGCCDSRGWRLILILTVGSLAGLLFLSFVSVLAYTAVVNRKKQKRKIVQPLPRSVEPRYSMETYLTVAGLDPDFVKTQGPPKSALQNSPPPSDTEESD